MDSLCNEIVQIIINELDDPTNLSLVSKRYYAVSQDPYIRAWYFLSRYGRIQALYWALGRGRLMNEQVIDTLLSSGAHLSRYLVQCAMHHYYRTAQVPFIKTPWVRSMHLGVFTHFQSTAVKMFGNIPLGKGDDDGSTIDTLIRESRLPSEQRQVHWETLQEILEKFKFIPFCNKDAMMANFPLALAMEPRLLPYARANGFSMDHKYRNFVFRKMFEKPTFPFEGRADEIVRNVQELSRLDPRMFLSRTVAAEICMEVKTNEAAYSALKKLDKEGHLRFELSTVVDTLIKTLAKTRSIASPSTFAVFRQLYADFPSNDPVVRLVLLLQIFISEAPSNIHTFMIGDATYRGFIGKCKEKVETIGLSPVVRSDLVDVLSNKFAPDRFQGIIAYARAEVGLSDRAIDDMVEEVAFRCLEIACKGKMLKELVKQYPFLEDSIRCRVMKKYKLDVQDLPPWEDEEARTQFETPLCQGVAGKLFLMDDPIFISHDDSITHNPPSSTQEGDDDEESTEESAQATQASTEDDEDLGQVGQDSLSTMIRRDEMAPRRGRRPFYEFSTDYLGKFPYPHEYLFVGKWILSHYGVKSGVAAIFIIHAIINETVTMIPPRDLREDYRDKKIPITLKHFKILARLGRQPNYSLFEDIEAGAEFFFSEEDYLSPEELNGTIARKTSKKRRSFSRIKVKLVPEYTIKAESSPTPSVGDGQHNSSSPSAPSAPSSPHRRRPRRSVASSAKSYLVPDSDDDMIADDGDEVMREVKVIATKRKVESNLQKWIKHLTLLAKEEQKKYNERKKVLHANAQPGIKVRVPKNEFHKSLSQNLARLRRVDREKRQQLYGAGIPDEDYSSGEEDEYQERTTRPSKRRKVEA